MCHGMGCPYEIGPYGDCGKPRYEPYPCLSREDDEQDNTEEQDDDEEND